MLCPRTPFRGQSTTPSKAWNYGLGRDNKNRNHKIRLEERKNEKSD